MTKIGMLTIGKKIKKNGRWFHECACDCGNKVFRAVFYVNKLLKEPRDSSCGCVNPSTLRSGSKSKGWKGCGLLSGGFYCAMMANAKARNLEFSVSIEYLWNLFEQQNAKCAISGLPIELTDKVKAKARGEVQQTASLDRRDHSLGYIEGNVWWVHKDVNKIRGDMSMENFLAMCREVSCYI